MSRRTHVAYVSYTGLTEPLGASQVLPYLHRLSSDYRFTILSFEKKEGPVARQPSQVVSELESDGNRWVRLSYHQRGGILAKAWDIASGVRALRRLAGDDPYSLIHARGYVPAEIARRAGGAPFLFDIRGLQAEESVDAGAWREGGLKYILTKRAEERLLAEASGIVTLTEAIRPYLESQSGLRNRKPPWSVIPCCVDLDLFKFDPAARKRIRAEWSLEDGDCLFVFSGSIGTWYSLDAAARLAASHRRGSLLVLTFGDRAIAEQECKRAGLSKFKILGVSRAEMPAYLSAADVSICAVRPSLSKLASSPTKIAESLACGLPVMALRGVGDLDALSNSYPESVVILDDPATARFTPPRREVPRAVAEAAFSLEVGARRYHDLYSCLIRSH